MSAMMIPNSLKKALRSRYEDEPNNVHESGTDHEWTITYSFSEWSGYHDETNYYSYSTTILDHEPDLSDSQDWFRVKMLPQNKEYYAKLFQGFDIVDLYEISKRCGYPEHYSKTVIKLNCPEPDSRCANPLWILTESSKFR